jgi:hypothetical protein
MRREFALPLRLTARLVDGRGRNPGLFWCVSLTGSWGETTEGISARSAGEAPEGKGSLAGRIWIRVRSLKLLALRMTGISYTGDAGVKPDYAP